MATTNPKTKGETMATYTINTDAYMTDIEAANIEEAVAKLAEEEGQSWETVQDFFAWVEDIDGAFAWIETEDGDEPRVSSPSCYERMG